MKQSLPTQIVTIQTRIPRDSGSAVIEALDAYADHFSRLERVAIATLSQGDSLDKNRLIRQYGITARQFNAIKRSGEGKIQSQLSNLNNYVCEFAHKIATLNRRVEKKLRSARAARSPEYQEKLFQHARRIKEKIQRLDSRKCFFEKRLAAEYPSICMGSRKLFHAQFNLTENGLDSHAQWLEKWQRERSSQFFVLGSKDETAGCQGCTIIEQDDGFYTLKIRMPDALVDLYGKYCYVTDVAFSHDRHWLEQAILSNKIRNEQARSYKKSVKDPDFIGPHPKESGYLGRFGQAISYRFVRDEKRGWRVLVTTDRTGEEVRSDRRKGAIGIDLNNHHLAVCEVDQRGNKVINGAFDIPFRSDGEITSTRTRTALESAAITLVDRALASGKPLVIENLDFRIKKAKTVTGQANQAGLNKIVSTLVYRQFKAILKTRAFKLGVEVIEVNPAYTSFIGRLKYQNQTQNSVHQAAGLVIARRGMGLKDRLPRTSFVPVMRRIYPFNAPEDACKDDGKSLKKAMTMYKKWFTLTREAASKRAKMFRLRINSTLEPIPF